MHAHERFCVRDVEGFSPAAFGGMSVSDLGEARSPQARRPGVDVVLASRLDETEIGDAQTA